MSWTVLVVEDDPEITTLLASVLGARGFRVVVAANGAEAIEQAQRSPARPAVIVLDVMMPVMDGLTFLAEQPGVPALADVPVIVVSATPPPAADLPASVVGVLTKPIKFASLIALVQQACSELRLGPGSTGQIAALKVSTDPS